MDMLHGSLLNKILLFSLPLAASSILQQLFNSVDVAVVGRFASDQALAAVGSNSSVISLMINLFVGISVGANVVIANYIGQKDERGIKNAIHTVSVIALRLVHIISRPMRIIDTESARQFLSTVCIDVSRGSVM